LWWAGIMHRGHMWDPHMVTATMRHGTGIGMRDFVAGVTARRGN